MLTHEIISNTDGLPVFFSHVTESTKLVPSHWHHHIEVLYILKGSMDIITSDSTYSLSEKDMFIINSGFIHLTKIQQTTNYLLLQIPYTFLENSIQEIKDIQFQTYYPYNDLLENTNYIAMGNSINNLFRIYKEKKHGYQFLFNSILQQFLYELYTSFTIKNTHIPVGSTEKNRHHLQKAIEYMSLHYNEHISLSEISKELALNSEYFCRMFKKNIGFTFLEYLNQIRLTYIYEDLMTTNDSILDIQERHGFSNYKVFNRMFKESYGNTPSKVRRSNRTDKSYND